MAQETVDKCIEVCDLKAQNPCHTKGLLLDGAHEWTPTMFIRLIQEYGLDNEVAVHLAKTYGDKSFKVAQIAKEVGWPKAGRKLHEGHPFIEAEVRMMLSYTLQFYFVISVVGSTSCQKCYISWCIFIQVIYAVREYAETAIDVLAHRTRLSFLDVKAAEEVIPHVVEIMSKELGWSKEREKVWKLIFSLSILLYQHYQYNKIL